MLLAIILVAGDYLVGAAEGCDLLIFSGHQVAADQDQKIAAFGSSYGGCAFLSVA
jgi:hypothetical protein